MSSAKQQLYVALYGRRVAPPRGSHLATHHWALLVGAEIEGLDDRGTRYHVKKRATDDGSFAWFYELIDIPLKATNSLDVRIAVAKVVDPVQLGIVIKAVPVVQNDQSWDCITWTRNALAALDSSGCLGARRLDWELVEKTAIDYIRQKISAPRFNGRVPADGEKVTTYNLMEGRETIP